MFQNVNVLQSAMNVSTLTTRVIANNIANASTPKFKASYVVPIVRDDPLRLEAKVVTDTKSSISNDGNNVDVNAQMALLSENTMRYEVLTQLASMSFKRYSDVLKGV
jgi:flagellar basal-body rod protein FlgB